MASTILNSLVHWIRNLLRGSTRYIVPCKCAAMNIHKFRHRVLVRSAKFGWGGSARRGWYMFPGPTATPRCHFNDNSPLMKDHPCSFLPLNAPLSLPLSRKIFQSAAFLCLDVLSDSHVPKQLVSSKRDDDDAVLFTVLGLCFFPLFLILLRIGQRI